MYYVKMQRIDAHDQEGGTTRKHLYTCSKSHNKTECPIDLLEDRIVRSLLCGDYGHQLRSAQEAQAHTELTGQTSLSKSTEPVLNLVFTTYGKPYCSKTESDLHTKRTGHSEVRNKTKAAKPIDLETKSEPLHSSTEPVAGKVIVVSKGQKIVVSDVNKELLAELEAMEFSTTRATRAPHFTGNKNIEAVVNWVVENENDPDLRDSRAHLDYDVSAGASLYGGTAYGRLGRAPQLGYNGHGRDVDPVPAKSECAGIHDVTFQLGLANLIHPIMSLKEQIINEKGID